jgi:preprotein translocase subunit SecA
MAFLDKFLSDPSRGFLKRHQKTVAQINALEKEMEALSDKELQKKTAEFKARISQKEDKKKEDPLAVLEESGMQDIHDRAKEKKYYNSILDPILPEAFAVVREAARRTVGQRHFDVQLLGGIALHTGSIAEMRTGEGKTLVATLPLYLNALLGKGVHLVTVNDYLAKLAVEMYGPVYTFLGLTVGVIVHDKAYRYEEGALAEVPRREAYACDITYGTNNEFGFDYLRDHMVQEAHQLVQRDLHFAIVDEVDSILIDEARTPLIISGPAEESADTYQQFARLVPRLKLEQDYTVDEKDRVVSLTREGIAKMEGLLGVDNIYGEEVQLAYHLEEALKAQILYKRDKDYVVQEGEVIIVDEFTGRLMPGRRYSEGLHQAIEAKEGVRVQRESTSLATISFQNLFRTYIKLSGMTGTAATEAEEFHKIYGLEVLTIPTNKPMIRIDNPDRIYKNEAGKFKALIADVKRVHETGQPILIGTISVEKNELLSSLLKKAGVPHEILNAKNHEREGHIIAEAGKRGAVTLATNMAGRGTDIMLGGIKPSKSEYEDEAEYQKAYTKWETEHDAVLALGGLQVVGTERHESRRIDNQLRGRAGRQGDPGVSNFYVSADDDLMRIFGGDRIKNLLTTLGVKDDEPIEHKMISGSLETAQKRVEGHNFDMRKRLIQFDDVLNRHREVIYRRRRKVLIKPEDMSEVEQMVESTLIAESRHLTGLHASGFHGDWNLERLTKDVAAQVGLVESERIKVQEELSSFQSDAAVEERIKDIFLMARDVKKEQFGPLFGPVLRSIYLQTIDMLWVEHLTVMQELRTGIGLRGYAQTDPLLAYQGEGHRLFQNLVTAIDLQTVRTLLRVERVEQRQQPSQESSAA